VFLLHESEFSFMDIMVCHDLVPPLLNLAVSFGFKSVDDYYSDSSSSKSVKHVRIPLLCIQAANDPVAPSRGIPREDIKVCGLLLSLLSHIY
jgi:predicted alpha/beta-fold hydrolase